MIFVIHNSYLFIISLILLPSFLFLQITETEEGQIVTLNEEAAQGTLEQISLVKQRAWNILNETEDLLKKAGVYNIFNRSNNITLHY